MNSDQSTEIVLILILLGLQALRVPAVKSFFSSFFAQFGVGSSTSSSTPKTPPHVNAPGSSSFQQQQATQKIRGM